MPEADATGRPHCSRCGIDMWLVRVDHAPGGGHAYVFECKVCGAQTLVHAARAEAARIEAGF